MIRYIENTDILFSISTYRIVSSKKILNFLTYRLNIAIAMFDNIAIFSTDCMTGKRLQIGRVNGAVI